MNQGKSMFKHAFEIGLIIAVLFLAYWLYNKGETSIAESSSKYDTVMSKLGNSELIIFENGSASGSDVLDLIGGLDTTSSYSVSVTNGKGNTQVYTADGDVASRKTLIELLADAKKKTGEDYINPNATFSSSITKDENGVVTQVVFTQIK